MVEVALLMRLEAKPGKEALVEEFLLSGLSAVQNESATVAWFGIRLGPSTFGIFDAFPNEAGQQAHLTGQVAAALMAKAPELLAKPPVIERVDVPAAKLIFTSFSVFRVQIPVMERVEVPAAKLPQ